MNIKIVRSDDYLKFIDSLPCLACGGQATHHHVRIAGHCGTGQKTSDHLALPLCPVPCHGYLHQIGEFEYWDQHFIDPLKEIINCLSKYIEETTSK